MQENIIVFRQYNNAIEANIAKTKLDAYGIPCFLTEENMSTLYAGQHILGLKVRLHLFSRDSDRAGEILNDTILFVENETIIYCPACRSQKITYIFSNRFQEVLHRIFEMLFPKKKISHCQDCNHQF